MLARRSVSERALTFVSPAARTGGMLLFVSLRVWTTGKRRFSTPGLGRVLVPCQTRDRGSEQSSRAPLWTSTEEAKRQSGRARGDQTRVNLGLSLSTGQKLGGIKAAMAERQTPSWATCFWTKSYKQQRGDHPPHQLVPETPEQWMETL